MSVSPEIKRLLTILVPVLTVVTILEFTVFDNSGRAKSAADAGTIEVAQLRAARMRQTAALVPAREAVYQQTVADLADRERGMIQAATAAQAQAALLEIARRVGKQEQIDVRGGDFGAPKAFGEYGLVYATVTFECHVEQLVNFLADLSQQPELVVPSEERIVSGSAKEKLMNVRLLLSGVVAKKLVPEKKALGGF